jgi:hypothetical protein
MENPPCIQGVKDVNYKKLDTSPSRMPSLQKIEHMVRKKSPNYQDLASVVHQRTEAKRGRGRGNNWEATVV